LSGGERPSVAIARAVHFGGVLILDEPTSAVGVKPAGVVLRYIVQARDHGLGVIFITRNPHHAYPIGDRFAVLKRGRSHGEFAKADLTHDDLVRPMSGGAELDELSDEMERPSVGEDIAVPLAERQLLTAELQLPDAESLQLEPERRTAPSVGAGVGSASATPLRHPARRVRRAPQ
jgi:ABC-type sugar transport system ATPase subunit